MSASGPLLPRPTERLRFREMTTADLDEIAAMLGDPEVMAFYPAPKTRAESAAWIERMQQRYAEHGHGLWITETHEGEFVGDCGLTWQSVNDSPCSKSVTTCAGRCRGTDTPRRPRGRASTWSVRSSRRRC